MGLVPLGEGAAGYARLWQPGLSQLVWPEGAAWAFVRVWGAGGGGGGSAWQIYGGGGASGGYVEGWIKRPASGVTSVYVGYGGAPIPHGSPGEGGWGQRTEFSSQLVALGGSGGQGAAGPGTGGDGGAGGPPGGTHMQHYVSGGQGQASCPTMFPMGAGAPCGGWGGNNNQDGMQPGGGGAPGNFEFDSGRGADGMVAVYWFGDD